MEFDFDEIFKDAITNHGSSSIPCDSEYKHLPKTDGYPKIKDFVAIDFETAKGKNPCQIGMAIVREGQIVKTINHLIRPEGNDYSQYNIAVHHITPNMTEDAPDFRRVWSEISSYFEDSYIVAHNARFDIGVLEFTLRTLGISFPRISGYICTCDLNNREGLELACARYGITLSNHHDGEDDAINCAKLYLAYVNNLNPLPDSELPEHLKKTDEHKDYWATIFGGHDDLRGDILKMDLDGADPTNPFYARKVVITGVFTIDRCELAQKLKSMGADIDKGVGSKLNYLLIGEYPGPSKLRKVDEMIANGKDVRKIFQKDLDAILAGKDWDIYHTELPVTITKEKKTPIRKTTWPDLVEKFQRRLNGEFVEFNERELGSEDYRLLELYIVQQQKVATTKKSVIDNLRQLDEHKESEFRLKILSEFKVGDSLPKEEVYERLQKIFSIFNLGFKAKKCVLTEFGILYDEFKVKGIHHMTINYIPET